MVIFMETENLWAGQGARSIGKHLLETYGENAFLLLVDEGGMYGSASAQYFLLSLPTGGFANQFGGVVAIPAIAEKGYIDVRVEVTSPGGHSSVPPSHTVSLQAKFASIPR